MKLDFVHLCSVYCQIYLTAMFKPGHVTTTSPDEVYLSYFLSKTYVVCTHRDGSFGDQYQNTCSLSDKKKYAKYFESFVLKFVGAGGRLVRSLLQLSEGWPYHIWPVDRM